MSSTGTGTSSTSETQALVNAYTNSNSMDDRAQANMEGQGRESRLKVLTPKANELYEDSVRNHSSLFEKMWADLDTHLQRIRCEGSNLNVESLVNLGRTIREGTDRLEKLEGSFFEYLKRKNTENSLELLEYLTLKWHGHALLIEQSHKELDMCIKQAEQQKLRETAPPEATPSEGHSRGSRSSRVSSVFSVTARKRAKAEAERARLLYAEEEAVLKKRQALLEKELAHSRAESDHRKADIKVELELLSQKKELAAATAEVKALEDLENASEQYALSQLPMIDPKTRTKAFVEEVASFSPSRHYSPLPTAPLPVQDPPSNVHVSRIPVAPSTMNPDAPAFIPTSGTNGIATDLTRFLLKKDLLLSRLTNFNDKAESFQAWKASFQSVMLDLGVTPREEIDLLEKWTGPESRKHVISLKASNYGYPERGLERIWDRLGERYGAPEVIEASLKQRLVTFPKITPKDYKKLFELSDLASEIESLREDDRFKTLLGYYDSSTGVSPIVSKLPGNLQEKWTNAAVNYMRSYDVTFPPFSFFAKFLRDLSKVRNNPSFVYDQPGSTSERTSAQRTPHDKRNISVRKTSTESLRENDVTAASKKSCFLHNVTSHTLNKCKAFLAKSIENRKKFLRDKKVCFRCCESTSHISRNCDAKLPCSECSSDPHCTALHFTQQSTAELSVNGEESGSTVAKTPSINVNCTQICGNKFRGKSCAKIVLVDVYHQDRPSRRVRLYSMIDDQSNMSLARPEVFDQLGVQGHQHNYVLSSVSGVSNTSGRECSKIVVESVDRSESLVIPVLLECDRVPEIRDEIPTPEVARNYAHLCDIAHSIPPIDDTSHIWMLIGRDVIKAHHVLDQRIGPSHTPYAQKLPLGWVIIGETCLGRTHIPDFVNVRKTNLLADGRPSLFKPCPNEFECMYEDGGSDHVTATRRGDNLFQRTKDDEKIGLSQEDRKFLKIMEHNLVRDDLDGNWVAPLPFRDPRPRLTNNRCQVMKRAKTLDASLKKDPKKQEHFKTFMEKIFRNSHAELAPPLQDEEECWYLPLFGVYHPRKVDQLRGVFDSSAKHNGISLNDVLLSGPDLANSLLGILMRFRREPVAIVADVQQMFYCFRVREEHRNYLRFLWYKDNDISNPLAEYRMCVHVFGNSPSPSIATLGLRKSVEGGDVDVSDFVSKNFYVDDGLTSLPTAEEAVDLMKRTQLALKQGGNLRLHKIASNKEEVMNAFPVDDLAKDVKDLDLGCEPLPIHCSLGVHWNLETDSFLYQVLTESRPYTRRGILSTVNGIFVPLGFMAPVVISGKHFLRCLMHGTKDWDEPLPEEHRARWELWKNSLECLRHIRVPRTYTRSSLKTSEETTIHVYADASEKAIAAVGYLHTRDAMGNEDTGFVLGKAKVAPLHGHTIPRLELCAAVMAVEIAVVISDQLYIPLEKFRFYTDSKVVLGYIYNKTRRFYTYVTNRVERILHVTAADQWSYVQTQKNPADEGTRSLPAESIQDSMWLSGPHCSLKEDELESSFELHEPDSDKELRPQVQSLKIDHRQTLLGSHRFERFSRWKSLIRAVMTLSHIVQAFRSSTPGCKGWHTCTASRSVDAYRRAELLVIKEVQREMYPEELDCLECGREIPRGSSILSLNPYLDAKGVLRVGGRLNLGQGRENERNPIIIPGKHRIAILLVKLFHEQVKHQGRSFTEGAIRTGGYWITGCKRLVNVVLHSCVRCRKLRGKLECQKMADIPSDRLEPGPPFTNIGLDVFGPWNIVSRRTRGGSAQSKRWAVMFTCLTTRGIHIEVIEELSSSSFINALRRFIALRGPVKVIRSDRGTNFIGAVDDLQFNAVKAEDEIKTFLYDRGATWLFNPPHASHMGGSWERMIGVSRRVLESMLTEVMDKNLTHEVLVTFLAEVCAIVNARPLVPVSTDPDDPFPLSPSVLLTMKSDYRRTLRPSRHLLFVQSTVEESATPCRHVLETLEDTVSPYSTTSEKVE